MKTIVAIFAISLSLVAALIALSCGDEAACNDTACDSSCHQQWNVKGICVDGFCQCQNIIDDGSTPTDGDDIFPTDDDDDDDDTTDGDVSSDGDEDGDVSSDGDEDGDTVTDDDDDDSPLGNLYWQSIHPDNGFTLEEAEAYCSTLAFGGRTEWRVPNIKELRSIIVDCEASQYPGSCNVTPSCNSLSCSESCDRCLPETVSRKDSNPLCPHMSGVITTWSSCQVYWSSTPVDGLDQNVWGVVFSQAYVSTAPTFGQNFLICVTNDQTKVVKDYSQLEWQIDFPSNSGAWPIEGKMTFPEAQTYCDNLELNGKNDWRMPTVSELRSLIVGCQNIVTNGACTVEDECTFATCFLNCNECGEKPDLAPYWDRERFGENIYAGYYTANHLRFWTQTPYIDYELGRESYLSVHFGYGNVDHWGPTATLSIRCVRGEVLETEVTGE